jgi:hypothetical protein
MWRGRYEDITAFEKYLTRNGIAVRKFFLNVSRKEQKRRFPRKELEIFRRRRERARVLGGLPGRLRKDDSQHGVEARALGGGAGGQ